MGSRRGAFFSEIGFAIGKMNWILPLAKGTRRGAFLQIPYFYNKIMVYKNHKQYRLPGYDYSSSGDYFITICTHNRINYFGEISGKGDDAKMHLSPIGTIAKEFILKIPVTYPMVILGEWKIMPNHVHLIISINKTTDKYPGISEENFRNIPDREKGLNPLIPGSVSSIINHYKGDVKKWCNKNDFSHFVWQSKFNDHIIRNPLSYNRISNYIANNIYNWDGDTLK